MKKTRILSLTLMGVMTLQGFGGLVHADVTIDGQTYTDGWISAHPTEVANYIKENPGVAATVLQNSNQSTQQTVLNSYNQATGGNMSLQQWQQWVNQTVTNTPPTPAPRTFTYGWQTITVDANGNFNYNGKTGTLAPDGTVTYNGKNMGNINTGKIDGQDIKPVSVSTSNRRIVSGTDRNGAISNVDIDFLAQTMKNGSFNVDAFWVNGYAQWLGFSDAQIKDFQTYVNSHSAKEIADKLATMSTDAVLKIDEIRPRSTSGPGIAMRVSPDWIASGLKNTPEAWQNVLEYAGIPVTKTDLDKFYTASKAEITQLLSKLPNDQFEKIQAYFFNGVDQFGKPYISQGWDDKSAYSPEIGRVVTPAEKNAIERIKYVAVVSPDFSADRNGNLTAFAKSQVDPTGSSAFLAWKPDTFKKYLTEAAIADYVAHPDKGAFAGGSNNTINWKDGTTTTLGNGTIANSGSSSITTATSTQSTNNGSVNTGINPYKQYLSSSVQQKIDTWITSRIVSKKESLGSEGYNNFLTAILGKLDTAKSKILDQDKLNIVNYLISEIQTVQDQTSDSSFLDELIR